MSVSIRFGWCVRINVAKRNRKLSMRQRSVCAAGFSSLRRALGVGPRIPDPAALILPRPPHGRALLWDKRSLILALLRGQAHGLKHCALHAYLNVMVLSAIASLSMVRSI